MEYKRIVPADVYETEEDLLRARHLRAFAAAAGRLKRERLVEAQILSDQPTLTLRMLDLAKGDPVEM